MFQMCRAGRQHIQSFVEKRDIKLQDAVIGPKAKEGLTKQLKESSQQAGDTMMKQGQWIAVRRL